MTADNTTLDEEERNRVNNNHDDLETLLANRDNEAMQMEMQQEVKGDQQMMADGDAQQE
jgi:hypothetical protein